MEISRAIQEKNPAERRLSYYYKMKNFLIFLFILIIASIACLLSPAVAQPKPQSQTFQLNSGWEQLIGVGFYSLFSPQMKYQQFARITRDSGCNLVRVWAYNSYGKYFPWKKNPRGRYDLRQLDREYFKMMSQRIAHLHRLGLKVMLVLFDESGLRALPGAWENHAWNWRNNVNGFIKAPKQGIPDFYQPEYWPFQRRYLDMMWQMVGKKFNHSILFEINNEGSSGWQWEKRVIAHLRAKGARYIASSSKVDMEQIIPLVDIYSFHGVNLAEQVDASHQGKKYMWSSDGKMQGSSGVIQFKGRPETGHYPSAEEIHQLTKKVLQIGGHLEFNLSGRLEANNGLYDSFLLKLIGGIRQAVAKKYRKTKDKQRGSKRGKIKSPGVPPLP